MRTKNYASNQQRLDTYWGRWGRSERSSSRATQFGKCWYVAQDGLYDGIWQEIEVGAVAIETAVKTCSVNTACPNEIFQYNVQT